MPQVPIAELPLSAILQMLQHKEDTHQDFTLTLIPPAAGWLPDADALLGSATAALDSARVSASAALEKTRSSGWPGALDALGLSAGAEGTTAPAAAASSSGSGGGGGGSGSGEPVGTAWAQISLDGPSRLGGLGGTVPDTQGLLRAAPAVAPAPEPAVDYSAYYRSSSAGMVQQTAAAAPAVAPAPAPAVDYSEYYSSSAVGMVQQTAAISTAPAAGSASARSGGSSHSADVSAGLDSMFSSSYSGAVGDEDDDVPISRGFMKSGYEVGEQITILSRRNQWRQCMVKQKRPGQLLVRCCAEDGPGLGADGEREEWLSQASRRIRDYWDGQYLPEPPPPSSSRPAAADVAVGASAATRGAHVPPGLASSGSSSSSSRTQGTGSGTAPPAAQPPAVDLLGMFTATPGGGGGGGGGGGSGGFG
jgi:hypothetical protein